MTGLLMLQKYQSQQLLRSCSLFFEKVAQLIQYTCDCNPEYSVEAFDWDWASFHDNILLPNRMHIRSVMQLQMVEIFYWYDTTRDPEDAVTHTAPIVRVHPAVPTVRVHEVPRPAARVHSQGDWVRNEIKVIWFKVNT